MKVPRISWAGTCAKPTLPTGVSDEECEHLIATLLNPAASVVDRAPRLYAMCGGIGAGKTTALTSLVARGVVPRVNVLWHAPDDVLDTIESYRSHARVDPVEAFRRYGFVARWIAEEALRRAAARLPDIVIDRGCAQPEMVALFRELKQLGYEVHLYRVEAPLSLRMERVRQREKAKGRHTPEAMIHARDRTLVELMPQLESLATRCEAIDGARDAEER